MRNRIVSVQEAVSRIDDGCIIIGNDTADRGVGAEKPVSMAAEGGIS